MWLRGACLAATLWLGATAARADCDHFRWSLAREKAWFAASPEPIEAGASVASDGRAFEVALKPGEAAVYALPLKQAAKAGEFGGVVRVAAIAKAGLYQVTVSREAWVDVIQNDARAKTRNVSRQRDCAAFAKSVRFELAAGPAALQFSGVKAPTIAFALAAAP